VTGEALKAKKNAIDPQVKLKLQERSELQSKNIKSSWKSKSREIKKPSRAKTKRN
jgi:hypothetical protein